MKVFEDTALLKLMADLHLLGVDGWVDHHPCASSQLAA